MSSVEEIILSYAQKKVNGEMSLTEIKSELREKHKFSTEEFQLIIESIQDKEFELVKNQESALTKITQSKGVAIFFLLFALVAGVVSILTIWNNSQITTYLSPVRKFLPWIILLGSVFLILKHGQGFLKK
ncbi:MAG: hypothetical protein ACPG21_02335 [Crocinitomicaceae bacterium]